MKRAHFTQKQIEECLKKINEQQFYVSDGEGKSIDSIAQKAKSENPNAGSDDSVVVPVDTVSGGSSVQGGNGAMLQIPLKEQCYTKKDIKEMKLRKLKENCVSFKKKDLK